MRLMSRAEPNQEILYDRWRIRIELLRKAANLRDGCGVEMLEDVDEKVHCLVKVPAIHDAVVRVSVTNWNNNIHGWNPAITFLDFGRIIAVSLHQIQLQRNVAGGSRLAHKADQFSIRQFGRIV